MSEIVALGRRRQDAKIRIGLLRLTDSAPAIVAHEFGFFAEEGVDAELMVEPSWANIADKLAYGFLDAAIIVPPLAFAVELGMRGLSQPMIIPCNISLGGNTVTLARDLAAEIRAIADRQSISTARALGVCLQGRPGPVSLGIVHHFSTHNLLLRYWLASGGLETGGGLRLTVVPPARAVDALAAGQIAGFCAGAPWGDVAARAGIGATIATSNDIWQNAPEKAFAVRARWAEEQPDALHAAIRALLRAAQFCDAPENASYTAALLSRRKYVDVDSHALLSSLPGGAIAPVNRSCFWRNAASFPWPGQALWFLEQMARWGLVGPELDVRSLAMRVYRPDIYRAVVAPLGISCPRTDTKIEGGHGSPWQLDALPSPIAMGPDCFCDGAVFDPHSASAVHNS